SRLPWRFPWLWPSSSPALLQFPRHAFCPGDIAALAGLVATAKQHIDGSTMTHEIDTESRTMVDTHFGRRRRLPARNPLTCPGRLATTGAVSAPLPSDLSSHSANRKTRMTE